MNRSQAEAVRERSCRSKVPYGRDTARATAAQMNDDPEVDGHVSAYRCTFDHPGRWHVGHTATMDTLRDVAAAIRFFHQEGP